MKTIIHVNQHVIKSNRTKGENNPVLTVKTYKSNTYAHQVAIRGESRVIYSPDKPLSCGAHVWIETHAPVDIIDTVIETGADIHSDKGYEVGDIEKCVPFKGRGLLKGTHEEFVQAHKWAKDNNFDVAAAVKRINNP